MYFSDQITLRAVTRTPDSFGGTVKTYTDTIVWANKKSATRSEFYAASMAGVKIDAVFEVNAEDYGNQTVILYDLTQYEVIRAHQKGLGAVELNCAVREVL